LIIRTKLLLTNKQRFWCICSEYYCL